MSEPLHISQIPEVAIILPVFNDAEWVAKSLDSCLVQTLHEIEIIVVDDASTDDTVSVVERYQATDQRIRLVRQETNQSAFEARRVGIKAATAPFVLFLDGDDEIAPETAATALELARSENADVVAFGCRLIKPDGTTGGHYERSMQPSHACLTGAEIVQGLFPVGKIAQGQLWRYLFARTLLTDAYASLPHSLILPRVNDLPIAFLALMRARKYVSTPKRLYRYFFRRGASGHQLAAVDDFLFIAGAIDSIDAIAEPVRAEALSRSDGASLLAVYDSVRLSVVGRVIDYVAGIADEELRSTCLALLRKRIGLTTIVKACADFHRDTLPLIASTITPPPLAPRDPRHIVLRASNLGTGGAQGVVMSQADHLAQSGFKVTIAVDSAPETHFDLPDGVQATQLEGDTTAQRVECLAAYCRDNQVDLIIDHWIFYNDRWPFFAIAASELGIPTIGWIHNFALRPIVDGSPNRLSFLERYLPLLSKVIVLSPADVAYWKLRGIPQVAYLPNPPSPVLEHLPILPEPRPAPAGTIEIAWWGRLQQSTKQVRELIEIGSALNELDVDFRLTIIGPDGPDLSREQLHELAHARGIDDKLVTTGPLHGAELGAMMSNTHVFVSTSLIEGYPLVLVEAQALGLPLVMYDLPWLATLADNTGVIAVKQRDRRAAAQALAMLANDPATYERYSAGARLAARSALAHDFNALYTDLVRGQLSIDHSPEPDVADMQLLLDQNVLFVEHLIARERRALDRSRSEAAARRKKVDELTKQHDETLRKMKRIDNRVVEKAPPAARTGFKGWLQRFVPTSMRQARYLVRDQQEIVTRQHQQLINNQAALSGHLTRLEEILMSSQKSSRDIVGSLNLLPTFVDRVEASIKEPRLIETQLRQLDSTRVEQMRRIDEKLVRIDKSAAQLTEEVSQVTNQTSESLKMHAQGARAVSRVARATDEVVWSNVFHDTIVDSEWFSDRALSPGRWAVGYPFLYVLYRTLDEIKPESILELGLGQSTKVIAQYAEHSAQTAHIVIEHDPNWIETFAANFTLPPVTHVTRLELSSAPSPLGAPVVRYDGFTAAIGSDKFDLIVIDGPFGFGQDVSRIDVLDLLPDSLADRFVIILDDAHRRGERATITLIEDSLDRAGIAHATGTYRGQKDTWIAVSSDLAFLTTL